MELYEEYYEIFKKYRDADQKYDEVLEEKARLIFSTQPGAIDTTKEVVNGGKTVDGFALFVEKLEKLEPELETARNERDLQNYLLKKKELQLRESNEITDKIYVLYFIDRMKVKHIAIKVNYTREWTYEIIKKMREKLNNLQKLTNPM